MMQHHKYSLTELDNMIPWEREIYVNLLIKHIAEENERKVSDTLVNQERTEMELAEGRRKELQGIDDAIDQLDLQIASM